METPTINGSLASLEIPNDPCVRIFTKGDDKIRKSKKTDLVEQYKMLGLYIRGNTYVLIDWLIKTRVEGLFHLTYEEITNPRHA